MYFSLSSINISRATFIQLFLVSHNVRTCQSCGRVRFYSLNFIFARDICNECYLAEKEREDDNKRR
ncbi:MAG: hypothetical protein C4292_03340 [Nitrososphaera sp.]